MRPKDFCEGDYILLEQDDQMLWTDGGDPEILRITQRLGNADEATIYLFRHELEEIAAIVSSRGSIQNWEDYLDAMERHDEATM